ncbi:hypothetical protein OE88DRAFT_1370424 [Heliocybe sulcata]|uniref:Uncharacterized protein n=1 Tax=Heliocybe sulcata TaxID=5364 RepID=A0A5C3N4L1_9AGAM|nr:hypothetical protein OE88DRAFT_1370424 [Heliocybe sulcata]
MASRLATKSFARVASASRSRVAPARRTMASVPHTASKGSDTPWIAGSALVFGGTAIYLLAPKASSRRGRLPSSSHRTIWSRDGELGVVEPGKLVCCVFRRRTRIMQTLLLYSKPLSLSSHSASFASIMRWAVRGQKVGGSGG